MNLKHYVTSKYTFPWDAETYLDSLILSKTETK